MANLFIESGKLIKQAGDNNGIIAEATNISCQYKFKNASAATGVEISTALADLLQRIQAIENTPSAPVITLTKGSLNGVVQSFTVKSNKAGTLNISTTAGTLSNSSFNVTVEESKSFTLSGNVGTNATAPTITLTEGTKTNNSCTFKVKSNKAGTLTLNTTAGSLSKTSLTMEANNDEQTVKITNNGTSTINPTITVSQTVAGTKGNNINYTVTVEQTVNSVQGSKTSSGTIEGTTGLSATSSQELTINNIPAATITNNYYLGETNASSISTSDLNNYSAEGITTLHSNKSTGDTVTAFIYPVAWGTPTILLASNHSADYTNSWLNNNDINIIGPNSSEYRSCWLQTDADAGTDFDVSWNK